MAQTLKEYLEEQRKAQKTPYFTNVQPDPWNPLRKDAFAFEEEPFTAESERMFGEYEEFEEPHPEFGGAPVAGELTPPPPPKPTAETVTPGGEIPEEIRKKHGLSKEAHYAYDQKIPKAAEAVPPKPTEEELAIDFKDRRKFRDHSGQMALQKFGINPNTYNPAVAMEEAKTGPRMQKLYQKVLMGKNSWTNRENLTPEQKKLWKPHENALLAQIEAEDQGNLKLANASVKNDMMHYDNVQKEVAQIPTGIRNMLKSIRRVVDPMDPSKSYTHVEPGEEAWMIKRGQELLREGKYKTAAEVVDRIQTLALDQMEKDKHKQEKKDEAMAAIPSWSKWGGQEKETVDAAKVAVARLVELQVPEGEIIAGLKAAKWKDTSIPNLFPDEAKPMVPQSTEMLAKEATDAIVRGLDEGLTPVETKGAIKYTTPDEIVQAEKDGTLTNEQAKLEFRKLTGV